MYIALYMMRFILRHIRRNRTKIVYRSEYLTGLHATNSHKTFDMKRFKKVRDALVKEGLVGRKDFLKAEKVSEKDLLRVHTPEYIESLRNPLFVGEALALDYINPWDNYVFEYFLYVTGGTILATQVALEKNMPVFNLGGGYHHAHPERAEGFCLINDVCVAIEKVRAEKGIRKVLIVDLDYHHGNGTLLFYKNDPEVFIFSIHSENWVDVEKQNNIDISLPSHTGDETYLAALQENLPRVFANFRPEVSIYLAGSDPFIQDALGDFDITESGMLERDIFVFKEIRSRNIPLAISAAGGYGPYSWKVYYNFIKWVLKKGK